MGGELDSYEFEGPDRAEFLQDLAEFQLAVVGIFSLLPTKYTAGPSHAANIEHQQKSLLAPGHADILEQSALAGIAWLK